MELIIKIAERAVSNGFSNMGDLVSTISKVNKTNPLRLDDLLIADDFNFMHDVAGILDNYDWLKGSLENHFLPRFTK
jgi:hypothetical protein